MRSVTSLISRSSNILLAIHTFIFIPWFLIRFWCHFVYVLPPAAVIQDVLTVGSLITQRSESHNPRGPIVFDPQKATKMAQ